MQPAQSPSTTYYKQSAVIYISGGDRSNPNNRHPAMLEWDSNNRIRLYIQSPAPQVIFDVAPSEIKSFTPQMNRANIELTSGEFIMLDFNTAPVTMGNKLGFFTKTFANVDEREAMQAVNTPDLNWWAQNIVR